MPWVVSLLLLMSLISLSAFAQEPEDDSFFQEIPVVVTPARLRQSLDNAPAAVTVLTREKIRQLGLRSVAEALRLVPGMSLGVAAGNDTRLEYHGTNGQTPRRMQVTVDGVSVFGTGFARVYWEKLPVALDDIERIEVVRTPNTSSYGANAMLAIVNIITRHPEDAEKLTVSTTQGSLDTNNYLVRYADKIGNTSFRMTFDHEENSGFDLNFTGVEDRRDDTSIDRFSFYSTTQFDNQSSLSVQFGVLDIDLADEFEDSSQTTFPDQNFKDNYFNVIWKKSLSKKHDLQIKTSRVSWDFEQSWNSCFPSIVFFPEMRELDEANPTYTQAILAGQVPSGGSAQDDALAADVFGAIAALGGNAAALAPRCGDVNQDYYRSQFDVEVQDTYVFNDSLRLVSGFGVREDILESETYTADREIKRIGYRLFANVEYFINPKLALNAGAMVEQEDRVLEDPETSPRLALNYHINDNHTLKFIVSKAIRTPDHVTSDRDWSYFFRNLTPPLNGSSEEFFFIRQTAAEVGDDQLSPEEIESREIVYYANIPSANLVLDFKVFDDKLTNLISEDINFFSVDYTNNGELRLQGAEFEVTYQPTNKFWTTLTFAYLDNDTEDFFEQSIYADRSGSLSSAYTFNDNWTLGAAYYAHLSDSPSFFDFRRTDVALTYNRRLGEGNLRAQLTVTNEPKDQGAFAATPTFTARNIYEDDTHYYFTLEYAYY